MKFSVTIAAVMLILGASATPIDGYGQQIKSRAHESTRKELAAMDGGV
ncbi:hypothetical protein PG995_006550 [Apiospora arundinis]